MILTLPNILTILRLVAVPVIVVLFYSSLNTYCVWVFIIASMTDFIDGMIARRWNQVSEFGKFLDPIADKLLVVTVLLLLIERYDIPITTIIILAREIVICSLREWSARSNKRIPVSKVAQWKTMTQMLGLAVLLSNHTEFIHIGMILIFISILLSYWSMVYYVQIAIKGE